MLAEVAGEYIESATRFAVYDSHRAGQTRKNAASSPQSLTSDGSARPQTVEQDVNPLYWRLIREFGKPHRRPGP